MRTRAPTRTKRSTLERSFSEPGRPGPAPSNPVGRQSGGAGTGVGFLLVDVNLKPLYTNGAAVEILGYARAGTASRSAESLQERIHTILSAERFTLECSTTAFLSGRRRYLCRPFLLESRHDPVRPPMVVLLLERCPREGLDLSEAIRRYHLSRREQETVQHLMHGLTTKEVAACMNVSPNTVQHFVRLIMTKMGVTTRSGIVGKLLGG